MTVLVLDYIMTFKSEVKYVWMAKWGVAKILFLLSRYPTFMDVPLVLYYSLTPNIRIENCLPIYIAASWATAFGIGMAEAILLLRTYAIWGSNRKLLIALLTAYVSIYVPVIVILKVFLDSLAYGPPPLPTVAGCHPVQGSNILFADFVLLMAFETTIMVLTLIQGVRRFRRSNSRLVTTLYRDGILYFVYLFLISAGNIIVLVAAPDEYVDLLNTFQRVMHSILSTRIILHLHQASHESLTTAGASVTSPIQFRRRRTAPFNTQGFTVGETTLGTNTTASVGVEDGTPRHLRSDAHNVGGDIRTEH